DHAEHEAGAERVARGFGGLAQDLGGAQHLLGLHDDGFAGGRDDDLVAVALEQAHAELFFELADAHAQGRLADEAGFRGLAEMAVARYRGDIAKLGEGHGGADPRRADEGGRIARAAAARAWPGSARMASARISGRGAG